MDKLKYINKILKALSDEGRLRIMSLLGSRQELCVCEIREIIGLSQPTISSHLKVLEDSGLIVHRKEGLWMNYRISPGLEDNVRSILKSALSVSGRSRLVREDLRRLSKVDRNKICSRSRPA